MTRRTLLATAFFPLLLAAAKPEPLVTGVDSIGMTVSDLDSAVDFYTGVLAFEKVSEYESQGEAFERSHGIFALKTRTARLRLGEEFLELTEFLAPRGRPGPADSRSNDGWFQHVAIIVSDMDRAYEWLRRHKVQHASPGPQRLPDWNPGAGGIRAFYFRDPDGHPLEILSFPPGKGSDKWHRPTESLFLGIDHTAIVISNTDASLRLYRDVLGLRIAGESENYGPEQERLNNVFGARLRITALRAATGPGIEFLEYVAPRDGRPYPPDERPNDLIHWQTRLVSDSAEKAGQDLRANRTVWLSPGVVELPDLRAGFRKSLLVRDPDGHAIQVIEK